ncbi:MAG: ribokinase [Acidimicrobiia bacterium]
MDQPNVASTAVVEVASLTMDTTAFASRLPAPGETILGHDVTYFPGGKGLNQALAVARQGVATAMIGMVGDDPAAATILATAQASGLDTRAVGTAPGASGTAHIYVGADGRNSIVMVPAANTALTVEHVDAHAELIANAAVVAAQLECPIDAVARAFELAHAAGVATVLNPAPAQPLDREFLALCDYVIPNETEIELLTGHAPLDEHSERVAIDALLDQGAQAVILTMGERGAHYRSAELDRHVPALTVSALDSTAAGDAFVGGFASALAEGLALDDALVRATVAGGLACTVAGASPSLPERDAVERGVRAWWAEHAPEGIAR